MRSLCGIVVAVGIGLSGAASAEDMQVMVGSEPDLDACLGQDLVHGLDPQGDNFLAVRTGPGSDNAMIDQLHEGNIVNVCAYEGRWVGIVYMPGDTTESGPRDCGVGTPIWPPQPYDGPCRSGWVFEDYLISLAG